MSRSCRICAGPLGNRNREGSHKACRAARPCPSCGGAKTYAAKFCRGCASADHLGKARRNAAVSRTIRDKLAADPAFAAHMRERGRQLGLSDAARKALKGRPDVVARRNATRVARRFAWCPEEYRPLYRKLNQTDRIPAVEARRLVEEQIRSDAKRRAAVHFEALKRGGGRRVISAAVSAL